MSFAVKQSILSKAKIHEIAIVMARHSPPTQRWWIKNYSLLDCAHFPRISVDPIIDCFNLDTRYKEHWYLIQSTFHFILGYKLSEYATRERGEEYMEMMKDFLIKVRTICDHKPEDNYELVVAELQSDFELLANFAHNALGGKMTWVQGLLKKCRSAGKSLYTGIFKHFRATSGSVQGDLKDEDLDDAEVALLH